MRRHAPFLAAAVVFAVLGTGDQCGGPLTTSGVDGGASDASQPPPCTPVTPPLSTAPAADVALARAIADKAMASKTAALRAWDWDEGILMQALVALEGATGVPAYGDYARAYYQSQFTAGYQILSSDACAPAIGAAMLYRSSCDARYRAPAEDVMTYLDNTALRTSDGGISHFGASPLFGATIWIDSLYMFGDLLARWGEAGPDARALDLYGQQLRIFAAHMQDDDGLFHHSYDYPNPTDADVHWGRGNGWVIASSTDYLRVRPDSGVADIVKRLAAGIVATQDPSGRWWTVMNRPGDTYLETSATALFALGLMRAQRLGVVDASVQPVIDKAMDALRANVVDGVVKGVSGPTDAGTFADYAGVPIDDTTPYGPGVAILALIEVGSSP